MRAIWYHLGEHMLLVPAVPEETTTQLRAKHDMLFMCPKSALSVKLLRGTHPASRSRCFAAPVMLSPVSFAS